MRWWSEEMEKKVHKWSENKPWFQGAVKCLSLALSRFKKWIFQRNLCKKGSRRTWRKKCQEAEKRKIWEKWSFLLIEGRRSQKRKICPPKVCVVFPARHCADLSNLSTPMGWRRQRSPDSSPRTPSSSFRIIEWWERNHQGKQRIFVSARGSWTSPKFPPSPALLGTSWPRLRPLFVWLEVLLWCCVRGCAILGGGESECPPRQYKTTHFFFPFSFPCFLFSFFHLPFWASAFLSLSLTFFSPPHTHTFKYGNASGPSPPFKQTPREWLLDDGGGRPPRMQWCQIYQLFLPKMWWGHYR